jgi:enamine deaminase RidA (YjgF/YER057c/UK114 family)
MSTGRKLISSGSPYEPIIGFSRAVRVGNIIAVGGTAPIGTDGKTVGVGDPAAQTRRCFEIIEQALKEAGAGLENVIRTRTFLTDISHWEASGRAHGEIFGSIRPASTMVQVAGFIESDWLVEIEADAVIGDGGDDWHNAWAASNDTGTPQS